MTHALITPIASARLIAVRVLLLVLSGGALAIATTVAWRGATPMESSVRYVCPMHADVVAKEPGECPICNMALEAFRPARDASQGAAPHHVQMPPMADITAVENVRKHKILDFVRMHSLLSDVRELRGAAWVDSDRAITAVFYRDQIDSLDTDEAGSFSLARLPDVVITVRRTTEPAVPWDASTSRIRFRIDAARDKQHASAIQPGQVGWVELARKPRDVLAVPASALLQSPEGPYVLFAIDELHFEKRRIEVGETFLKQGFAVVLSGLHAHDRVVSKATFFLDADRKLGHLAADTGEATP